MRGLEKDDTFTTTQAYLLSINIPMQTFATMALKVTINKSPPICAKLATISGFVCTSPISITQFLAAAMATATATTIIRAMAEGEEYMQ
jgi:hypothetical protein